LRKGANADNNGEDIEEDSGMMQGVSGFEVQMEENPNSHAPGFAIKPNGAIISTLGPQLPASDYDVDFFVKGHPHTFPNGIGSIPKGMTLKEYSRMIVHRYPRTQYDHNIGLLADLFNVWQRHEVLTQSRVKFKLAPSMIDEIDNLSEEHVRKVMRIISDGLVGPAFGVAMEKLPPSARTLLSAMKQVGGKVIGTPGSFLTLRSKMQAAWNVFGPYTIMINLCPYENNMVWVFEMAGEAYTFDALTGKPVDMNGQKPPTAETRAKVIAENPAACAHAFEAYLSAFKKVFMGWDEKEGRQTNPDCLFGKVLAFTFKFETGGRGGLHAHGQAILPLFQAENLIALFKEGEVIQKRLLQIAEHLSNTTICKSDLIARVGEVEPVQGSMQDKDETHASEPQECESLRPLANEGLSLRDWPAHCRWPTPLQKAQFDWVVKNVEELLMQVQFTTVDDASQMHGKRVVLDDNKRRKINDIIARAVLQINNHNHTSTCEKGGRVGDDTDCRMDYARLLLIISIIDKTGMFLLKRDHGTIVPYIKALVLASPCNHTMSLASEASRWVRQHYLWSEAKRKGMTQVK